MRARDLVALALHLDFAQLLGLAVDLPTPDQRLLRRHRHEDRVLTQPVLVPGLHADPARPEHGQARHLHPGDGDAHEGPLARFERWGQDRGDDLGVGLVHRGHRLRPDIGRLLRLDLVVHVLGAGAVAHRLQAHRLHWSSLAHHARRICVGSNALQVVVFGQSSWGSGLPTSATPGPMRSPIGRSRSRSNP